MQQHKIRRVPVVDDQKRLVGIVSLGDLAYAMAAEQTLGGDGMPGDPSVRSPLWGANQGRKFVVGRNATRGFG